MTMPRVPDNDWAQRNAQSWSKALSARGRALNRMRGEGQRRDCR